MSTGVLRHAQPRGTTASTRLRAGLFLSAGVHVLLLGAVVFWSARPEPPRPPVYRVNLVGAPPGPRQVGVVDSRIAPRPAAADKPAPSGAEQVAPPPKVAPTTKNVKAATQQAKATPTPTRSRTAGAPTTSTEKNAAPPKAGSGTQGGKGADVANVRTEGIAFPDPGYLNNVVRRLTLAWNWNPNRSVAALVAEIKFTIHRDGSVTDIAVVKGSGNRLYDVEAQGAIESVGSNKGFGPLPAAWTDDVLIVYFTFDYAMLR